MRRMNRKNNSRIFPTIHVSILASLYATRDVNVAAFAGSSNNPRLTRTTLVFDWLTYVGQRVEELVWQKQIPVVWNRLPAVPHL